MVACCITACICGIYVQKEMNIELAMHVYNYFKPYIAVKKKTNSQRHGDAGTCCSCDRKNGRTNQGCEERKGKGLLQKCKKIRYPKKLLDKAKDEEASKPFHQVSKKMNNQTVKTIK